MRTSTCLATALLLCTLAALPAGAQEGPAATGAAAKGLVLGVQPELSPEQMRAAFEPVARHLAERTGRAVRLTVSEHYGALVDELAAGRVDVARLSPRGWVEAKRRAAARLLATETEGGQASHRAVVVARTDSGLRTLGDLRGRLFSYVDPGSASGFLYPRATLAEAGEDPDRFFQEAYFAGSHDVAIQGVRDGQVDACATRDTVLQRSGGAGELVVLHESEAIPNEAWAARAGLDEALAQALARALLEVPRGVLRPGALVGGFVPGDDAAYDPVRAREQRLAEGPAARAPERPPAAPVAAAPEEAAPVAAAVAAAPAPTVAVAETEAPAAPPAAGRQDPAPPLPGPEAARAPGTAAPAGTAPGAAPPQAEAPPAAAPPAAVSQAEARPAGVPQAEVPPAQEEAITYWAVADAAAAARIAVEPAQASRISTGAPFTRSRVLPKRRPVWGLGLLAATLVSTIAASVSASSANSIIAADRPRDGVHTITQAEAALATSRQRTANVLFGTAAVLAAGSITAFALGR